MTASRNGFVFGLFVGLLTIIWGCGPVGQDDPFGPEALPSVTPSALLGGCELTPPECDRILGAIQHLRSSEHNLCAQLGDAARTRFFSPVNHFRHISRVPTEVVVTPNMLGAVLFNNQGTPDPHDDTVHDHHSYLDLGRIDNAFGGSAASADLATVIGHEEVHQVGLAVGNELWNRWMNYPGFTECVYNPDSHAVP